MPKCQRRFPLGYRLWLPIPRPTRLYFLVFLQKHHKLFNQNMFNIQVLVLLFLKLCILPSLSSPLMNIRTGEKIPVDLLISKTSKYQGMSYFLTKIAQQQQQDSLKLLSITLNSPHVTTLSLMDSTLLWGVWLCHYV